MASQPETSPRKKDSPLYKARKAAGLSMPKLAELAGTSAQQIDRLELGERKLTKEWAQRLATHVKVAARALVFDDDDLSQHTRIPVVGRVGAGGSIETEWENQSDPLFEIELPFPLFEEAVGFEISGISMWPRYDEGDVIVVSRHGEPLDGLLGFEAVVRTGGSDEGGNRYFKRVIRTTTPGLFDLESYNAPTMRDQKIAWAAGLIARVPASRFKKLNTKAVKQAVRKARKTAK